jgi:PAS domain-containing protein
VPERGEAPLEPTEALATLVAKLRQELAGVRTAMRNRAVIEQAKGVLMERLGISADESFDHLVRLSQRTNVKLTEVAATIVGTTAPEPDGPAVTALLDDALRERGAGARRGPPAAGQPVPGPRARTGRAAAPRRPARGPLHEALQAQHQLLSARIASAASYPEIAATIAEATAGWPPPGMVVVTVLEPDGSHRMIGAHGLSAQERAQWRRVPPYTDLPIVVSVRERRPVLAADRDRVIAHFPIFASLPYPTEAVFAAPLVDGDRVVGALGLSWHTPIDDGGEVPRYLAALADPVARRVRQLGVESGEASPYDEAAIAPAGEAWLPIVLDALLDPAVVLAPARSDGQVSDFVVEYANEPAQALAPDRIEHGKATLLSLYPRIGSQLLLPQLTRALHSGFPVRLGPLPLEPTDGGGGGGGGAQTITASAARIWDRVVLTWRVRAEAELIYPQLLDAERIARIGAFSWSPRDGEQRCSPQLYRMYHGDGQPRPITPDELVDRVHPDDLPAVRDRVHRMLAEGKQLSFEFRGAGPVAGRRLRVVVQPVLEAGQVVTVRGTVQDVTDERAVEGRLRLAEEALAAQRRRLDAELQAAQALQRALLPTEPELGTTEGLVVRGRCRATERTGRVDGDWYDACALPDGATLLVVGDVAGSGLAALTAAARLRYAVRAYAALDMSPAGILDAVNAMLCSLEPERTATLTVARYEPATRLLRWAVAGHAAPVRYAKGGAELLPVEPGLPAGAAPGSGYTDREATLAVGDRVLLYTDGMAGAADSELLAALDARWAKAAPAELDDLEALVSHLVRSLHAAPDEDMGAMLVRITR